MKKIIIVLLIILDILAITCLAIAYGPNKKFKNFIVTTSMATMNHKYIARTLYSDKTINKVLEENSIKEINEKIDKDEIKIGNYKKNNYVSIYEEQILKNEKNDPFKIVKTSENGNTYYMAIIYDPSKIELALTSNPGVIGETIKDIAENNDAILAINASGFRDSGGMGNGASATGAVVKDSKIVWNGVPNKWGNGLIGFDGDHRLILTKESPKQAIKEGLVDGVTFGPFLIINGKESEIIGNGGSGVHPRTIIAQRKDGIVLFIVIDGNGNKTGFRGGVDYKDMIKFLKRYDVYNAANLDGGASSIMISNNKIVNNPVGYGITGERRHPNAWILTN